MIHFGSMSLKYKRLLLKLSGEQLAGEHDGGVDTKLVSWIASEIKKATDAGAEIAIMIGGGNYARGNQLMGNGIRPTTAHNVGMLATVLNGLVLGDVFRANGVETSVLSNIVAEQVVDSYTYRRADHHLAKGRVVVVAGGIGRPFFTTDTAAVNLALELDCDVVCKVTKVDGVYTKDPAKFDDAKKIDAMSLQQAVEDENIKVMDKAALGLALETKTKVLVFDLMTEGNIRRAALGEPVGTLIS